MKNFAAFFVSSLISISAFADFGGQWQGRGNYADGENYTEMCSSIKLDLAQTPTAFTVNSGEFECESLKITLKPFTFNVQDGEIIDKDGNLLGSVDDTYFFAKVTDPQLQWTSTYQVEITPDGMEYKQTTVDTDGKIVFTLDGLLQKP